MKKSSAEKNIAVLFRTFNLYLNHELKKEKLTASEIMYLNLLFQKNGVSQEELSRELCVNKSTTARTIGMLEKKNLIIRKIDESDRRVKRIYASEKAAVYKSRYKKIQKKLYRTLTEYIEPKDIEIINQNLVKVIDNSKKLMTGTV